MTKSEAIKSAKLLQSHMKTKGWKIFVWHNIEWHYCIENCEGWTDHKFYSDPNEAFEKTLNMGPVAIKLFEFAKP